MRPTTLIGLLLGGLLLAGCHGSSSPQPSSPGTSGGGGPGGGGPGTVAPTPTANLSVVDPSGAPGPFAIDGLDNLVIAVDCANLAPGSHALRVAVISPNGSLHAQFPTTLLVSEDGQGRASSTLRVRGSTIETFRQVGSWQLVANVDDLPLAAASVVFTE